MVARVVTNSVLTVCFVLLLVACFGNSISSTLQAPKKLFDLSSSHLSAATLKANIQNLKARGFSGTTVRMTVGTRIFKKTPYPATDLESDTNNLKQTDSSDLPENLLKIDSATDDGWSWLSDSDWAATEVNIRAFAKAAKVAGFKGFAFDPEPYGPNPWLYTNENFGGKSLAEVSSVVRERGKRFMALTQAELPNARLLFLKLLNQIRQHSEDSNNAAEYELLKAFFEGILEVANSGVKFVDGNEDSYDYTQAKDFDDGRAYILGAESLLPTALHEKFKRQVSISHSLFVDGLMNLYASPRFIGYYLKNNAERLKLFEHNIYNAARSSDSFVWVYSESINWWTGQDVPANLEKTMKSALNKVNSGKQLGFEISSFVNPALVAFKTSINISGTVTKGSSGARGAVIRSGISDANGNESACVVYNDLGNFDCVLPQGWSGTLTPTLQGSSFEPPNRVYSNLKQGLGNQDFNVK